MATVFHSASNLETKLSTKDHKELIELNSKFSYMIVNLGQKSCNH